MADLAEKKIVIAGGSGFLSVSMAQHFLAAGASVSVLSRSVPSVSGDWSHHVWDARTIGAWTKIIDGADAVVNLVGRTVNCIKTPDHQDVIVIDRIQSDRAWPLPSSPWVMRMTWSELLFAHWPIDAQLIAEQLPVGLAVDTFNGQAWWATCCNR